LVCHSLISESRPICPNSADGSHCGGYRQEPDW
jgi:hypothetical protein